MTKCNLSALNPFLDIHGIFRVGGRLLNVSDIPYENSIILSCIEPFSLLYFRYEYKKLLHIGLQSMLETIRLQYWPVNGRKTVVKLGWYIIIVNNKYIL